MKSVEIIKSLEINKYVDIINKVITSLQSKKISQAEYDENVAIINSIGEPIIASPLRGMLRDVKII